MGTVRDLQAIAQPDGTRAQRLTVDFANEGRKMINTAVAPLDRASAAPKKVSKPSSRRNTPQAPLPSHQRTTPTPAAAAAGGGDGASSDSPGSGWLDDLDGGTNKPNEL